MSALTEIQSRLRAVAVPTAIALVGSYFAYHVVQGEHGLISYIKLRSQISEATYVSREISTERQRLENDVALLRPDNLDLDMLEEAVRRQLNFNHPDEIVILLD